MLDFWRGEEGFGRPLGCVATTFTFDAALFEEQCLARFLALQSNPNETAKAYLIEREEKLSQCFACVLVDQSHVAPDRSLRWHLLPVTLPRGGIQHAKLSILAWENCVRVLIGSANLTDPGYRKNQEHMAVLDFQMGSNGQSGLLRECVHFIDRLRRFAPGHNRSEGPQVALGAFLRSVETWATKLGDAGSTDPDAECRLISLVPDEEQGGRSVLALLGEQWRGPMPDKAWVLSPFYNEGDDATRTAQIFSELLTTRGPRRITFLAPGRKMANGTIELDLPEALTKSSHSSLKHGFGMVLEYVEHDRSPVMRPLHAKSIWLQRDQRAVFMVGSSNFTLAGFGLHAGHNIELNLAYELKDIGSRFAKICDEAYPAFEELEEIDGVKFLGATQHSDETESGAALLPSAFRSVLYRLAAAGGFLELELGPDAPEAFSVLSRGGVPLLDAAGWRNGGAETVVAIAWGESRPPSALDVHWVGSTGEKFSASWVVNVADAGALPPPDELKDLTLAELLDVLTSSRPIYQTVVRILDRREKAAKSASTVEVDPHRKVDTSNFLLRRMRRLSYALEGLRERLEQPIFSLEALRWRLRGPVGPVALAARLAQGDPDSAAFLVAEVAVTLSAVQWHAAGSLDAKQVRAEASETLQEVERIADVTALPLNLRNYVTDTFGEIMK